jgi:hypothetical protein
VYGRAEVVARAGTARIAADFLGMADAIGEVLVPQGTQCLWSVVRHPGIPCLDKQDGCICAMHAPDAHKKFSVDATYQRRIETFDCLKDAS